MVQIKVKIAKKKTKFWGQLRAKLKKFTANNHLDQKDAEL